MESQIFMETKDWWHLILYIATGMVIGCFVSIDNSFNFKTNNKKSPAALYVVIFGAGSYFIFMIWHALIVHAFL